MSPRASARSMIWVLVRGLPACFMIWTAACIKRPDTTSKTLWAAHSKFKPMGSRVLRLASTQWVVSGFTTAVSRQRRWTATLSSGRWPFTIQTFDRYACSRERQGTQETSIDKSVEVARNARGERAVPDKQADLDISVESRFSQIR